MTGDERDRLYRRLGGRVRQFREERPALTQTELSEKVGLSRTSIANIERGRQHPPLHVIWGIAEALEVDLGELLPPKHEVVGSPSTGDPKTERKVRERLDDEDEDTIRRVIGFVQQT